MINFLLCFLSDDKDIIRIIRIAAFVVIPLLSWGIKALVNYFSERSREKKRQREKLYNQWQTTGQSSATNSTQAPPPEYASNNTPYSQPSYSGSMPHQQYPQKKNNGVLWTIVGIVTGVLFILAIVAGFIFLNNKDTYQDTPDLDDTDLRFSQNEVNFTSTGGTEDIRVFTHGEWECDDEPTWVYVTKDGSYLTIKVNENTDADDREGKITITAGYNSKTITVRQEGTHKKNATYLDVSESELTFDSDEGSREVSIGTDGEWSWDFGGSEPSWTEVSTPGNTIIIKVSENTENDDREASIIITAGDYERTIDIKQEGSSHSYPDYDMDYDR